MLKSKEQVLSNLLLASMKYPTSIGACATYVDTCEVICSKFNIDLDDQITNYKHHAEILCMEYMKVNHPDTDYDLYISLPPCYRCARRIEDYNHRGNIKNFYTTNLMCGKISAHSLKILNVDVDNYLQHCLNQPWANLLNLHKSI